MRYVALLRAWVLALTLSPGFTVLLAQPSFEHYQLLDKERGLPSNVTMAICKDSMGFVWIGTTNGLCRFDGSHIKTYQNIPGDSTSLFDDRVYALAAYRGKIWVGTSMGLSILDPLTEQFTHLQFDSVAVSMALVREVGKQVLVFHADPWGDLWIGTYGLGTVRYRADQDRFQFFPISAASQNLAKTKTSNELRALSLASATRNDSLVYCGTASGLQEINRYTGISTWYSFPQATPKLEQDANAFLRLYCHDNGLLYCGSWAAGIHLFDPEKKSFRPLPVVDNNMGKKIAFSVTRNMTRKSEEEFWITTSQGIAVYHIGRQQFTYWKANDQQYDRLFGIGIIDESDRVWYPVVSGVELFDPALQQVVSYSYRNMHPPGTSFTYYIQPGRTDDEIIFLPRHENAVYHFDLNTRRFERSLIPDIRKKDDGGWANFGLSKAPDGSYTIQTEYGFFRYSAETRQMRSLDIKFPTDFFNLRNAYWDRSGKLWVSGSADGLYRLDPSTGRIRHFVREFFAPDQKGEPPYVYHVWEDSKGHFWFRRADGFSIYLPEKDTVINFTPYENRQSSFSITQSFAEDHEGHVWLTGPDGWLGYADIERPELGIVKRFNLRDSLGLSHIYFLAVDRQGALWGITNEEMFYRKKGERRFQKMSFDYAGGNVDFFSFECMPGGELIIGGRNEIMVFDPTRWRRNTELPRPYIEAIQVQGKLLPHIPLINGEQGLSLRYWENYFAITFSAVAYTLGNKCRFRYRLEGLEDWVEAGSRRYVNYSNVPGGAYTFQIQVANNEGVWNPEILSFPVWIETAWWATWWFRTLAILTLLGAGYGVYRYRVLQIRRQERLKSAYEKRLANVEMSALLAQMNPHFLFNCLNSIDSYIIRNESKKASEYLNNFARLMRLILNNSRSNYISLKDEVESLDLYLQMESLRFKDKFDYEIRVDTQNLEAAAINIPPMLLQPFVENAIWHGLMHRDEKGGKVIISISLQHDSLICTIEDNGVGRTRAMEISTKRGNNHRQSMGMQITEDRIDLINKLYGANTSVQIIDLYDDAGESSGTKVVLTIPI